MINRHIIPDFNCGNVIGFVLLIAVCCFVSVMLSRYAAEKYGGNKGRTAVCFTLVCVFMAVTLTFTYGLSAVTVKGIIFTLILTFSSYSDIRTRECADYLHLMTVTAAFIGTELTALPGMLLSGIAVGAITLIPALLGKRSLGGADIKCSAACAFLLGFGRGMIGLVIGLLLAVIINAIRSRKKKQTSFPLIPYLAVGFTAAYFI